MKTFNSFIYLWFNKNNKRFYLGKHTGHPDDGYICSSKNMLIDYNANPQFFKRRIIQTLQDSTSDEALKAELRWLKMIKHEELNTKYYNLKRQNFGSPLGCKKSYVWNVGKTKSEREEYLALRKNKFFCLLSERPKKEIIFKQIFEYKCVLCQNSIFSKSPRQFCSNICHGKFIKLNPSIIKGRPKGIPAWNKGIPNPLSAENGKKNAAKQAETVKGRKRAYREDGSWYWTYPNKSNIKT